MNATETIPHDFREGDLVLTTGDWFARHHNISNDDIVYLGLKSKEIVSFAHARRCLENERDPVVVTKGTDTGVDFDHGVALSRVAGNEDSMFVVYRTGVGTEVMSVTGLQAGPSGWRDCLDAAAATAQQDEGDSE
tara:strand:+ start:170 stop:574 length:405 start_codon:yes stop_codon:yes gene_type:complete